jgi:hypothetical protein
MPPVPNEMIPLTLCSQVDSKGRAYTANNATLADRRCARDHKWSLMADAVARDECLCDTQVRLVRQVYRLWKCTAAPDRACTFNTSTGLANLDSSAWNRTLLAGDKVSSPVQFPDPEDPSMASKYLVDCVPPVVNCTEVRLFGLNDDVECPAFCSFAELKFWVDQRFSAERDRTELLKVKQLAARIRTIIYDLKYGVDLLDTALVLGTEQVDDDPYHLGDTLPDFLKLEPSGEVHRLDMCLCENTLRCPNGTSTISTLATGIKDCIKSSNVEVVQRLSLAPALDPRTTGAAENTLLSDLYQRGGLTQGMGMYQVGGLEVLSMTVDFSGFSNNFTYGDHYQISVYVDCLPCPPRYVCDPNSDPEALRCLTPSEATQAEFNVSCADCCKCQRHQMPAWMETNKEVFPKFDNKHTIVTLTFLPVKDVSLAITIELLHSNYIEEFKRNILSEVEAMADPTNIRPLAEFAVFTPYRARRDPQDPLAKYSFVVTLRQRDFDSVTMPLNLPQETIPVFGSIDVTSKTRFENRVFIDRPSDRRVAHPTCVTQPMALHP